MDEWAAIDAERSALADQLAGLTPEQWNAQSLCDAWQVRNVVAHLIEATEVKVGSFLGAMVRNGFNFNRVMASSALARGAQPTDQLLADFRAIVGNRGKPPMAKPIDVLFDTVVHGQDIRRPLGIAYAIPAETTITLADRAKGLGFPFGTKKRIAGLHLEATDAPWSTGSGPEVSGPIEALVMVMAGRDTALSDLAGDGLGTLTARG